MPEMQGKSGIRGLTGQGRRLLNVPSCNRFITRCSVIERPIRISVRWQYPESCICLVPSVDRDVLFSIAVVISGSGNVAKDSPLNCPHRTVAFQYVEDNIVTFVPHHCVIRLAVPVIVSRNYEISVYPPLSCFARFGTVQPQPE